MKSFKLFFSLVLVFSLMSTACSKSSVENKASSSAGALTANTSFENASARPFGRQNLSSTSSGVLTEFILPEVRARLDEEPTGDTDGGYDPATSDPSSGADVSSGDSAAESQPEQAEQPAEQNDETHTAKLETAKFAWAKKSFGDAVKADATARGVIVLYADENYYDTNRLMEFVERGRDIIAERSGIPGDRFQVVFGGYRSVAQVEYWVVPQAGPMPEFKPDDRNQPSKAEN